MSERLRSAFILVAVAAAIVSATASASTVVKVGVFNPRNNDRGIAFEAVYKNLKAFPDLNVDYIHDLTVDGLEKNDVVLFACVHSVAKDQPREWKDNLRTYVEMGGSVALLHDNCGFAHDLSPALFPEIEGALRRGAANTFTLTPEARKQFPVAAPIFTSGWSDYVIMEPGKDGTVLAKDANGLPSVVCGTFGMGKVIAIGPLAGYNAEAKEELAFLADALRWAGTGKSKHSGAVEDNAVRDLKKEMILLKHRVNFLEEELKRVDEEQFNGIQYLGHRGQ